MVFRIYKYDHRVTYVGYSSSRSPSSTRGMRPPLLTGVTLCPRSDASCYTHTQTDRGQAEHESSLLTTAGFSIHRGREATAGVIFSDRPRYPDHSPFKHLPPRPTPKPHHTCTHVVYARTCLASSLCCSCRARMVALSRATSSLLVLS